MTEREPVLNSNRRWTLLATLALGIIGGAGADAFVGYRQTRAVAVTAASRPILSAPSAAADTLSTANQSAQLTDKPLLTNKNTTGAAADAASSGTAATTTAAAGAVAAGKVACSCVDEDESEDARSPLVAPHAARLARQKNKPFRITRCRSDG